MGKMNQEVKLLVEKNNKLREKLTDENKKYYEDILLYIRTTSIFYDENEVEILLFQILQDIISAQNNGETAEEYLGKDSKLVADELISQLSKASLKQKIKLVFLVFGISSFFSILGSITNPDKGVNILVLLLNAIFSFILIEIIFISIHKNIYRKINLGKVKIFILTWILCIFVIGIYVLIELFTPNILTIHFSDEVGIGLITLLVLFSIALIIRKEYKMFYTVIPFILLLGSIGIFSRISFTKEWIVSSNGKIIVSILIVICAGISHYCSYLKVKSEDWI